ncbi:hypothetical protein PAPYR_6934 [Paratrimastix pyriformis]|uniref:Rho-GAP domain-containing protein n=1 Tax=Paratrimastix pyriformis TaxID=342808 RepID=A0ABQ8UE87_9EUKA|nr:hypothetical protein PAPYR_6934 [Paratrimastix pyriformis]
MPGTPLPGPRCSHTAVVLFRPLDGGWRFTHRMEGPWQHAVGMWVFGGRGAARSLNELWRFCFATRRWDQVQPHGPAPPPRYIHTAIPLVRARGPGDRGDQGVGTGLGSQMVVFGGYQEETRQHYGDVWLMGAPSDETVMKELEDSVPAVLRECVQWLDAPDRIVCEGIFRVPGEKMELDKMCAEYRRHDLPSRTSTLPAHQSPHYPTQLLGVGAHRVNLARQKLVSNVASFLKLYLRELRDPIVPFEFYDAFLAAGAYGPSLPMSLAAAAMRWEQTT